MKMWKRMGLAIFLAAGGAASAGGAARVPSAASAGATPHALNIASLDSSLWPATLDPADVTDTPSIEVLSMLYANLVRLDSRNRAVPDLARSWDVSGDGRVYTFHLRPDARFSDGKPVTAADVAYSLARALSPKALAGKGPSPAAPTYLGHIAGAAAYAAGKAKTLTGVAVVDPQTVRITLDRPIAFFLQTLSYATGDVVERGTPLGGLTPTAPLAHQVSSGPFKLAAFRYKSTLTLVPNPGYYDYKRMKLRRVVVTYVGDLNTMYQGYEAGQYAMTRVPANDLATARRQPDFHSSPILGIDYVVYNMSKPPFSNKNLRLAASYAINRDLINNRLLSGAQTTIYSIVPRGIPGYDADGKAHAPGYDPAKARAYLALARKQLGAAFPKTLTIDYYAGEPGLAREYTELQYEWRRIGLDVHVQAVDLNTWLGLVAKPTASLDYRGGPPWVEASWGDDYPDPQDFTTVLLGPTSHFNIGDYANPRFQSLIAAAETARGAERAKLYIAASHLALDDAAWTMIGQGTVSYRWRPNITGLAVWTSNDGIPQPLDNDWTNVDVR